MRNPITEESSGGEKDAQWKSIHIDHRYILLVNVTKHMYISSCAMYGVLREMNRAQELESSIRVRVAESPVRSAMNVRVETIRSVSPIQLSENGEAARQLSDEQWADMAPPEYGYIRASFLRNHTMCAKDEKESEQMRYTPLHGWEAVCVVGKCHRRAHMDFARDREEEKRTH